MGECLLKIENVTQAYDDWQALSIAHLTFEERKIHAITGPNGSGKTTLCSILALLLEPTTGNVWYRGKPLYKNGGIADSIRKKVTMVLQSPFLFNASVETNVAYGLKIRKYARSQWEPRVEECLKLMGIQHLRQQRATRLSGGETQRVAVARALAIEPEVLILDEFTANVDQNYSKIMEEVIQDVFRKKEITIFVVTHDERQALRFAHTCTHLINGEVAERDLAITKSELLTSRSSIPSDQNLRP